MLPILENVEHDPIPAFLTTVGNISVAYWYTMAKLAVMKNLPTWARAALLESVGRKGVMMSARPQADMKTLVDQRLPR